MADIAGSYYSNSSYYPRFTYNISYSQTGRSGSAVSYRFNVSFSRSSEWYGYDIQINWNIGGATGSKQLKGTADAASGSTSFDVTCSTNAAGGTLGAKIWTSSNTDGTHWQNSINTGDKTVNKSTFNTPPSLSGSVTAGGTTGNKTIPENTGTITVNWPAASDANNNLSGYRVRVSINGGGYTEIARTGAGTYKYDHNVSGYGEGASFRYVVDAYDSYDTWSGNIYSGTLTKNRFTPSTITTGSSIGYSDGNSSVSFTVSGGSNSDGSGILSRKLTCDGISVYNNSVGTGSVVVTVFRTGATPTGPYVKFDDIKNKFSGANFKGTLKFNLTTSNYHTNVKTNSVNMSVNLQTQPNAVPSCSIVEGPGSTAYKQVASTKTSYFIPEGSRVIEVTWGKGSGKLGEFVTYDVYVAYGSGSWQLVASNLHPDETKLHHNAPKQSVKQLIKYKIRTKTGYGLYSDRDTSTKELHFYNQPGLSKGTVTRGGTTCDVQVTVNSNSSIPNINTVGNWVCYNKGTTTVVVQGNLTQAQTVQTIKLTGLTDSGQYDLKVNYNDDTGFSSLASVTIPIGANSPIFFVNKYGVGVNGVKANATYPLLVKGSLGLTLDGLTAASGLFMYPGDANGAGMAIQSGGAMVVGSGESPRNFIETLENKAGEITYITSDSSIEFVANCQTIANKKTASLYGDGTFNAPNVQVNGQNVYHTGRKPTAGDVGALPINGGTLTGSLYIGNGLSSSGANNTAFTRIVRTSSDKGSSAKIQFGNGDSSLEVVDNGWSKSLFGITSAGWVGINGKEIVAQGSANSGRFVKFYDGTMICWGGKWIGSQVRMGTIVTGVYSNVGLGLNGFSLTFGANFASAPYCVCDVFSTGYTNSQCSGTTASAAVFRIWSDYETTLDGIQLNYMAIGRWY